MFLAGVLSVAGAASLDANSAASFLITGAGTTPGTDYGQLIATGNVNLGNSQLDMILAGVSCPLNVGNVYTLVTTGSLTGTFGGVPDNTVVTDRTGCADFQIHYTSNSIIATVVPPPANVSPPAGPAPPANRHRR